MRDLVDVYRFEVADLFVNLGDEPIVLRTVYDLSKLERNVGRLPQSRFANDGRV